MIDIYEIRTPLYRRVAPGEVLPNRDYLVRKLDANNRAVATIRIRVDDIKGLEEFEQTVTKYLTGMVRTDAYRKTDQAINPRPKLDIFV